ncbi:hypothetical protein [Halomonas organivorans]|uniref:Uncharacterized protein n=1 Tax=Halomonas organivorans TaxID=257772 RepID=A0A7W5C0M6_9GAMM|nr:hypothetical protein [Halomonas organivorans]MBB3142209.1 hypothetical protein [Halomonas organivorans]
MPIDTGRWIAYGGGPTVTATSLVSKAHASAVSITPEPSGVVSVLQYPLFQTGGVQLVAADLISVGGIALVACRLTFDVWKYLDQRRRARGRDDAS